MTDEDDFTHVDDQGSVQMVDIGGKPSTVRRAVAAGEIQLAPATIEAIRENDIGKGDVLATARIGAIRAVKHTWEGIPMCHQIPITNIEVNLTVRDAAIDIEVTVETVGQTGCEMEALEGVTTGLNVVWDMVKSAEKDDAGQYPNTVITGVRVLEKEKGAP